MRLRWVVVALVGALCLATGLYLVTSENGATPAEPTAPSPTSTVAAPTATPEPLPRPLEGREFAVDENGTLPPGVVVYYVGGFVPSEGPPRDVRRAYRTPSGRLHIEKLHENLAAPGELYTIAIDAPTARVAIGMCTQGYCGGYGEARPGSQNVLYLSDDGGITWGSAGSLPLGSLLRGFVDDGLLVRDVGSPARWWVYPGGREFPPPPGGTFPVTIRAGSVLWRTASGDFVDATGAVAWRAFDESKVPGGWLWSDDLPGFAYGQEQRPGSVTRIWFAQLDRAGEIVRAFWSEAYRLDLEEWLDGDRALVIIHHRGPGATGRVGLADLATGQVSEWSELLDPGANASTALLGTFAVVKDTGSCLHVREVAAAGAQSLGCFADGVLLKDLGQTADADGQRWLNVQTPAGVPGWASLEYLDR